MAVDPLQSPVVVDGIVSNEKVAQLLALQTEYPELDYKATIKLDETSGVIELAKDVGAMQVLGGYILGGVDNQGRLTGNLDHGSLGDFDEARLVPKLQRYLPRPVVLRTNVVERDGHMVAAICVLPSPSGCAFFVADGQYEKMGRQIVAFRAGDVFWRDGTRSTRMTQDGLEAVVARRISAEKEQWIAEQQEIRRRERAELEQAYEGRRLAEAPLGTVNLDFEISDLTGAALDLLRRDDTIALQYLVNESVTRARDLIERDDIAVGLADLLDKLTCLSATYLEYAQQEWFERGVGALVEIYGVAFGTDDARRFGYASNLNPQEVGPRVWLEIIERVFALGALAVRRSNWDAVRTLTLQLPEPLVEMGYDRNWLRHALTMASRAQQFERVQDGQTVNLSLLSLARNVVARLACLRPDGLGPEDDSLLTSLAQFDVLASIVAVGDAGSTEGRVFYPNFARFRQDRIQRIVNRLLTDDAMRNVMFTGSDEELAQALQAIGEAAHSEGWRFDGFDGWDETDVGKFITDRMPTQ